jgi:hypothetical protein
MPARSRLTSFLHLIRVLKPQPLTGPLIDGLQPTPSAAETFRAFTGLYDQQKNIRQRLNGIQSIAKDLPLQLVKNG